MSKVGASYDSVVLGVSEQVPQDRRPGQHAEQINFISDPVRGLARRWGSVWQDEQLIPGGIERRDDFAKMREYSFTIDSVEYSLLYRAQSSVHGRENLCFLFNKSTSKFVPVVLQPGSGWLDALAAGGVSAVTCVGRYLYIAGNNNTPTYTQENRWGAESNRRWLVGWVRSGKFSTTYSIKLTAADGSTITAEYKTKPSAYPEVHDTSGIPLDPENPEAYQKAINDANNLYNSRVTAYIGEAAADITPENIATKLQEQLAAAGVTCSTEGGTVVIERSGVSDIQCDDSGDGSTFIAVGNEVNSQDKLSTIHRVGKVVRIRPRGAQAKESFYLEAFAKSGVGTGWQEVIWRETAGVKHEPQTIFSIAVVSGGTLYIAQDPASLRTLTGDSTHPDFKSNEVGDGASAPIPNFYGRRITLLAVFQDRLVVGSEGTVSLSRPGDYLNFFRQTVLDIRDNDPLEMYAYGAEGDILRSSALFDRDLVIFGDQKQYAISGRTILSPKNPNISVMSSHEDSTQAHPASSGNLVFYGKQREGRTSVHQLQVGQLTESPESFEISQVLDTYLKGRPAQLVALTSPNTLVFRTEDAGGVLYIYNYVDTPAGNERLFDSWSTWEYPVASGTIAGAASHKGELIIYTMRLSTTGAAYLVADRQSLSTELAPRPYMDSMRLRSSLTAGWHQSYNAEQLDVAIDNRHESFLFGDRLSEVTRLLQQIPDAAPYLWIGATSPARVQPTNPYMRDRNGKAIVEGRLTLTQVTPSFANTAGMEFEVTTSNGTDRKVVNVSRVLGSKDNLIGVQPVTDGRVACGVGREVRECSYTIHGVTWMPITITALSWVGQFFNRIRRAG